MSKSVGAEGREPVDLAGEFPGKRFIGLAEDVEATHWIWGIDIDATVVPILVLGYYVHMTI